MIEGSKARPCSGCGPWLMTVHKVHTFSSTQRCMTHIDTLDGSTSRKSVSTTRCDHRLVIPHHLETCPRRWSGIQRSTAVAVAVNKAACPEEEHSVRTSYSAARRHHQARPSVRYSRVQAAQCHAGHRALGTHMAVPLRLRQSA